MARQKSSSFPTGLVLLALAGGGALLGYFVLAPSAPADAVPETAENSGSALEFEFYDRLQQDNVETNSLPNEPAEPGAVEISQLVEQLSPTEPSPAQARLELATGALEEIAESIVSGLESRAPDPVAAPLPLPPAPVEPAQQAETVLAAPEPAPPSARESDSAPATESTREPAPARLQQAAAEPAPTPQTPAAARATGTFLQSGAFSQRDRAQSELERQRSLGLNVEITQRPGRDGPLFLIQSGPFAAGDKLEEAELVFRLHNIDTMRRTPP